MAEETSPSVAPAFRWLRGIQRTLRTEAKWLDFAWKPTVAVAWVSFVLTMERYHPRMDWYWEFFSGVGLENIGRDLRFAWLRPRFMLQFLGSVFVLVLMREPLRSYGLGLGKWKLGLKLCLLFGLLYAPLFVIFYRSDGFQEYYGGHARAISSWQRFVSNEVPRTFWFMVRVEFLYRGFLLFAFKKRYGAYAGILASMIPYVLFHFDKPEIETFGSFPVGVALAYLAVRTESIWYGVLLHGAMALMLTGVLLVVSLFG